MSEPTLPFDITLLREVAVHYRGRARRAPDPMRQPVDAVRFATRIIGNEAREHFFAIYLDGRHRPIAHAVVSVGTATAALVHPREVFQPAVLIGAVAVLLLHNHPSGDPTPSREDRELTKRLCDAGRLLGITVLDHIVFAHRGGHCSLRDDTPSDFAPPAS